ncbi:hypothetical protein IFR05_011461 [Cadophora sp. M221]|nr:hypothetical protein IFR05_011461 [Cadophora sp. M221]
MSSEQMIIVRSATPGVKLQEFRISRRLLCSRNPMMRAVIEELKNVDNSTPQEGILFLDDTPFDARFAWQGFFEWAHRGIFTIPELPAIAAGTHPGNRVNNIRNAEDRILHAYRAANDQEIVDFQNKAMDALYDKGRMTKEHLSPQAMRSILRVTDVDTKMQKYCAVTICIVLPEMPCWGTPVLKEYGQLLQEIQELFREMLRYRGLIASDASKKGLLLHNVMGYCAFHKHPNGEKCYLKDGSLPLPDWDPEVERIDKGRKPEEEDDEMEEILLEVEEGEDLHVRTRDVIDSEDEDTDDDIPAVGRKRRKCLCTENDKRHMLHNCS